MREDRHLIQKSSLNEYHQRNSKKRNKNIQRHNHNFQKTTQEVSNQEKNFNNQNINQNQTSNNQNIHEGKSFFAFYNAFQQSKSVISEYLNDAIDQQKKKIENRVYFANIADTKDYLNHLYHKEVDIQNEEKLQIELLLSEKIGNIQNDIKQNKLQVFKKKILGKEDLLNQQRKNQLKLIKVKEKQIKQKINHLKQELNDQKYMSSNKSKNSSEQINLQDKDKIKQIQEFIKKLNQQKQQLKKKKQKIRKKQQEELQKQERIKEELKQKQQNQKRQKLVEKLQQKQELKLKEEQNQKKKKQQFKEFLNKFTSKKPLYQLKEQEFYQKVTLPEQKKKQDIIKKIKQEHKQLDIQEIENHQRNYLQAMLERKFAKAEKINQQKQKLKQNKYFKGRYHSIVVSQMNKLKQIQDPRQIQKQKKVKQSLYSQRIKESYMPKIDINKRKELETLIQKNQSWRKIRKQKSLNKQVQIQDSLLDSGKINQNNQSIEQFNSRKDGIKNLEQLHKMIQNYKKQGKIKKQNESKSESLQIKKDYLKQLIQKREQESKTSRYKSTIQNQDIQNNDVDRMKLKLDMLDEKAKRKQVYLRNNKKINKANDLQVSNKLEYDYLNSIRAKINLLNRKQQ